MTTAMPRPSCRARLSLAMLYGTANSGSSHTKAHNKVPKGPPLLASEGDRVA